MSISDLTYAGLEQAINQHIAMDAAAQAKMAQLHGRVICLEVLGTGHNIYLIPGVEMVQLFGSHEGDPECLLQGSPMTIAQLRSPISEHGEAIPEDMQVSGDRELAEQFCRIMRQVEINWEAHLAKYTGSLIAGELGKIISFASYWCDHIEDTLKEDIQGLLQQDTSILPSSHEIAGFGTDVGQLAEQLERLQKKVNAIQKNKNPKRTAN